MCLTARAAAVDASWCQLAGCAGPWWGPHCKARSGLVDLLGRNGMRPRLLQRQSLISLHQLHHSKVSGCLQRSHVEAAHESLVVQVRQGRADDRAERASLGSMADTRSLDSFQSLRGTTQASKRNRVRAPRLENLRCGDAHGRPNEGKFGGGQGAPAWGVLGVVQAPCDLPLLP